MNLTRGGDDGFAMASVVVMAALVLTVLVVTLSAVAGDHRSSARQRELVEARVAGASALEYLYAWTIHSPDFFDEMSGDSPATYRWVDHAAAAPPDPAVDADWNAFSASRQVETCATRAEPCWELRFDGDDDNPEIVVAEAVVRFGCRGDQCSTRRFQQHFTRLGRMQRRTELTGSQQTEWARSELAEVTAAASISPPTPIP